MTTPEKIERLCRAICEAEMLNPDQVILPETPLVGALGRMIVYGTVPQWAAYSRLATIMLREVEKWRDD